MRKYQNGFPSPHNVRIADKKPVRRANKPNRFSQHGLFPSIKNGFPQEVESRLERLFCLRLEIDPSVRRYQTQPRQLFYKKPGSTKIYHLTPDVEIWLHSGRRFFVEVKPKDQLELPDVQRRLRITQILLEAQGEEYLLVTEDFLYSQPYYNNALTLKRFVAWSVPDAIAAEIERMLTREGPLTFETIEGRLEDWDPEWIHNHILALIAQCKIFFDPSKILLGDSVLSITAGPR